jgi:hypothetical protein
MGKVRLSKDYFIEEWSEVFQLDSKSPSGISWNIGGNNKIKGKSVGWLTELNYWRCEYKNKSIQIHRIIYYLHYGYISNEMVVDHKNGNPSDNSILNLRLITYAENCRNKNISKNNRTGTNGVHETHDFIASWQENGKHKSKKFSVLKYGIKAKQMAELFRYNKIADLNAKGYNYSETHGIKRN